MLKHLCILSLILHVNLAFCEKNENDSIVPITKVFHGIGANVINTFTYNYGLNVGIATAGTYGLVHTGFDWHWNRLAYKSKAMSYSGMPSVAVGGLVPMIVPASLYFYGRRHDNIKLQVTGLALLQSAILGAGITSAIKTFTGRRPPGIWDNDPDKNNFSADFKFGIFRRGAFDGWPSGHTTTAFAMAITLTELYPDNLPLKIGALTYASIIGLGVSVNIHWFSDAFAGVFLGYALGKTVGKNFNQLLDNKYDVNYSFYVTPDRIGFVKSF